jgi:hypothetical protein
MEHVVGMEYIRNGYEILVRNHQGKRSLWTLGIILKWMWCGMYLTGSG